MTPGTDLLLCARDGSLEDFRAVVEHHQHVVFRILSRYERDAHLVEDLAQETFIKVWRALRRFDPERGSADAWIGRIAVATALDHLRRRQRRPEVSLDQLGPGVEGWLCTEGPPGNASSAREILEGLLTCLSPEERIIIVLQELENRDVREIALLTGFSAINVRVKAFRARRKLERIAKMKGRSSNAFQTPPAF